ncbi:MAG: hypothetical protein CSA97_03705 [Bacteroidetes bacterium]|nr:MAG: hypothetical protein CSA97_03705 [Bacteroidota bacterium]
MKTTDNSTFPASRRLLKTKNTLPRYLERRNYLGVRLFPLLASLLMLLAFSGVARADGIIRLKVIKGKTLKIQATPFAKHCQFIVYDGGEVVKDTGGNVQRIYFGFTTKSEDVTIECRPDDGGSTGLSDLALSGTNAYRAPVVALAGNDITLQKINFVEPATCVGDLEELDLSGFPGILRVYCTIQPKLRLDNIKFGNNSKLTLLDLAQEEYFNFTPYELNRFYCRLPELEDINATAELEICSSSRPEYGYNEFAKSSDAILSRKRWRTIIWGSGESLPPHGTLTCSDEVETNLSATLRVKPGQELRLRLQGQTGAGKRDILAHLESGAATLTIVLPPNEYVEVKFTPKTSKLRILGAIEGLDCSDNGAGSLRIDGIHNHLLRELAVQGNGFIQEAYDELYCMLPKPYDRDGKLTVEDNEAVKKSSGKNAVVAGWTIADKDGTPVATEGQIPCGVVRLQKILLGYYDWQEHPWLNVGQQKSAYLHLVPANATNQEATFTSSDETIATVDDKGVITGISDGEVTITATIDDFGEVKSDDLRVKVRTKLDIDFDPPEVRICEGESHRLTPVITPEGAPGSKLTWSELPDYSKKYFYLDENHVIWGRPIGQLSLRWTKVTATSETGFSASTVVNCLASDAPQSLRCEEIWLRPSDPAFPYWLALLTSLVDIEPQEIASSNPDVVSVGDVSTWYALTPKAIGDATISMTMRTGEELSLLVHVVKSTPPIELPAKIEMSVGQQLDQTEFMLGLGPKKASFGDIATAKLKATDETIVNNRLIALKKGSTDITFSIGGDEKKVPVVVSDYTPVTELMLDPLTTGHTEGLEQLEEGGETIYTLPIGSTYQCTPRISPANAASQKTMWNSHKPAVAKVNGRGLVTAIAEGETVITALTDGDYVRGTFRLRVVKEENSGEGGEGGSGSEGGEGGITEGEGTGDDDTTTISTPVSQVEPSFPILSPNPVSDFLTVQGLCPRCPIRIYAASGQEVRSHALLPGGRVDVRGLPAGLYILRADGQSARFVKE